jgi:hypothetical protein
VADLMSHIDQANHNEQCARFLIDDKPEYRDWAITAAFYAAVHLAEASFSTHSDIGHSAIAKDKRKDEGIHDYRERKIRELARSAYRSYKKLREASQHARYLALKERSQTHQEMMEYYSVSDVRRFIERDLTKVREELAKAFGVNLD